MRIDDFSFAPTALLPRPDISSSEINPQFSAPDCFSTSSSDPSALPLDWENTLSPMASPIFDDFYAALPSTSLRQKAVSLLDTIQGAPDSAQPGLKQALTSEMNADPTFDDVSGDGGLANDPNTSLEDIIFAAFMTLFKSMDKQIAQQAQNARDKGAGSTQSSGSSNNGSFSSSDEDAAELRRLTDKRSQVFQIMDAILTKYSQEAQNVLRSGA